LFADIMLPAAFFEDTSVATIEDIGIEAASNSMLKATCWFSVLTCELSRNFIPVPKSSSTKGTAC